MLLTVSNVIVINEMDVSVLFCGIANYEINVNAVNMCNTVWSKC